MKMRRLQDFRFVRYLYYWWKAFESKHSYNHGKNNVVQNRGVKIGTKIQIQGKSNQIAINNGTVIKSTIRIKGDNNQVIIKDKAYITEVELFVEGNNCVVEIGAGTFVGRYTHIACTEDNSMIMIGASCMISSNCHIRTGDSHSILDFNNCRINPADSVQIGDHCWLGEGVRILKGVRMGNNAIVATGAVVTKPISNNVLVAGVPARVIKECVCWNEHRL